MTDRLPLPASTIADWVGGELIGEDKSISSVAPADKAQPGSICFVRRRLPESCQASVLLTSQPFHGRSCILVDNPRAAFALLLARIFPEVHSPRIHPGATIHPTAEVDETASIYPGLWIGADCKVGAESILFPNVVLYPKTRVGKRCRIHAGVVLGADGFSYEKGESGLIKIPQVGSLCVGDDVEIGANSCVDRAFIEESRIGKGTKLDNLVHIGHNATLGTEVLIAAQSGISGSCTVGDSVLMGGQVGVSDHSHIENQVQIGAKSGVHGRLKAGGRYWGVPALPHKMALRMVRALRKLPKFLEERR